MSQKLQRKKETTTTRRLRRVRRRFEIIKKGFKTLYIYGK